MARNQEERPAEQPVEQAAEQPKKQPEQEYDPWQDLRTVYIPKMSRTEQNTLEVGVNDKTYFIPKEMAVEVPEPVYEVVQEMCARRKQMEENASKTSGTREFPLSRTK